MVRDYGLPIQNTILLLLRPDGLKGSEKQTLLSGRFGGGSPSVSQELISQQIVHSIGWQNHEENLFSCVEIETDEDLSLFLAGLWGCARGG